MAAADVNTVMDAVGVALATISGLRVFDFATDGGSPPLASVGLPEVTYDYTKGRGSDHLLVPVTVLVGKVVDRAARDQLAEYLAGSGAKSIKAAVDGNLGGACQTCRVQSARPEVVTLGGVEMLGATFDVSVVT